MLYIKCYNHIIITNYDIIHNCVIMYPPPLAGGRSRLRLRSRRARRPATRARELSIYAYRGLRRVHRYDIPTYRYYLYPSCWFLDHHVFDIVFQLFYCICLNPKHVLLAYIYIYIYMCTLLFSLCFFLIKHFLRMYVCRHHTAAERLLAEQTDVGTRHYTRFSMFPFIISIHYVQHYVRHHMLLYYTLFSTLFFFSTSNRYQLLRVSAPPCRADGCRNPTIPLRGPRASRSRDPRRSPLAGSP